MISKHNATSGEKLSATIFRGRWRKVIAVMASLVVFCTTYMMTLPAITMSSQQTKCGIEEHQHVAECYDAEGKLICILEEHIHTLACYSDLNAEIENEEIWTAELPELTGDRNSDVIAVAESLINYRESDINYLVSDDNQIQGYSRFGHWYGDMVDRVLRETANEVTAEIISEMDAELAADVTGDVANALYDEIDAYVASKTVAPAAVEAEGSTGEADLPEGITVPNDIITGIADYVSGNITVDRADEISRFVAGLRAADIAARIPARITEKMIGINPAEIAEGHVERLANGLPAYSYKDWDAMFVSYVLNYAQITDFGAETDVGNWSGALAASGKYIDASGYVPKAGDLVFFTPYAGASVQVGIVSGVNKNLLGFGNEIKSISVILGNSDNSVAEIKVALNEYNEGDVTFETIHGYGVITPRDPEAEEPEDTSRADSIVDYLAGLISPGAPEDERVADEAAAINADPDVPVEQEQIVDGTEVLPADESTEADEVIVPADDSMAQTEAVNGGDKDVPADDSTADDAAKDMKKAALFDESKAAADDKSATAPDNSKESEETDSTANETIVAEKDGETNGAEVVDTEEVGTTVEILENGLSEDGTAIVMNWQVTARLPENVLPAGAIIRVDTATGKAHAMPADQAKEWAGKADFDGESVAFTDNDNFEVTFVGDNGQLYTWVDVQAMKENAAVAFTGVQIKVLDDVVFAEDTNSKAVIFGFVTSAKVADANVGFNYYVTKVSVDGRVGTATHIFENGEAVQVDQNKILQDAGLDETGHAVKTGKPVDRVAEKEEAVSESDIANTVTIGNPKVLIANGKDYTVKVTCGPGSGIPKAAKLRVSEIKSGTKEYEEYIDEAKTALGIDKEESLVLRGRFFDIKIITKNGELTIDESVKVDISYDDVIMDVAEADLTAVHFSKEGVEQVPVEAEFVGDDIGGASFEAESFSVYGIVYTVDVMHEGYTYALTEGKSAKLADIITLLDLPFKNSDIESVSSSDEATVLVSKSVFGNYMINNVAPFEGLRSLTVQLENGDRYIIDLTLTTDWDMAQNITAQAGGYTITVALLEGMPEGTYTVAAQQKNVTEEHAQQMESVLDLTEVLENGITKIGRVNQESVVLIDITIYKDGKVYEPEGEVKVSVKEDKGFLESLFGSEDEMDMPVIHFKSDGDVEALDIDEGAFVTETFSEFAVNYTVDFEYKGYQMSLFGGESYDLVGILLGLGIEIDDSDIENATFSDSTLVEFTKEKNIWMLNSKAPFTTYEEMKIYTENTVYVITVKDALTGYDGLTYGELDDLANSLSVTVNGTNLNNQQARNKIFNLTFD